MPRRQHEHKPHARESKSFKYPSNREGKISKEICFEGNENVSFVKIQNCVDILYKMFRKQLAAESKFNISTPNREKKFLTHHADETNVHCSLEKFILSCVCLSNEITYCFDYLKLLVLVSHPIVIVIKFPNFNHLSIKIFCV